MLEHRHKFRLITTKKDFEAVDPEEFGAEDLYRVVEYAILMCYCDYVAKTPVQKQMAIVDAE